MQYIEFLFQFSIILLKGHLVLDSSFFQIHASELLFFTINSKNLKERVSNGWHFSFFFYVLEKKVVYIWLYLSFSLSLFSDILSYSTYRQDQCPSRFQPVIRKNMWVLLSYMEPMV